MSRVSELLDWIADTSRAGRFFFFSVLGAALYAASYQAALGGLGIAGRPIPLTTLFLAGLAMIVVAFIRSSRARVGTWPTMPMVAYSYLFALTLLRVLLGVVDDLRFLPGLPEALLIASSATIYWMVFVIGVILVFGSGRGWNRQQVDPWPFRFIFRDASAASAEDLKKTKPKKGA